MKDTKLPIKCIEWMLTTRCNYACEYCCSNTQNTKDNKHSPDSVTESMLNLFGSLDGSCHVKLIGGEPFVHPRFIEISKAIADMGHTLSLTTNFSCSQKKLEEYLEATGDKLNLMNASLHIQQVKDRDDFVEKCAWFQGHKSDTCRFTVSAVVTEENFEDLCEMEKRLSERGVTFHFRHCVDDGKFVQYSDRIVKHIYKDKKKKVDDKNNQLCSTICRTGYNFIAVNIDGKAYRCWMPQLGGKLGSIPDKTFALYKSAMPCLSPVCTCDVAAYHKMIEFGNKANGFTMLCARLQAIIREIRVEPENITKAIKKRIFRNK